MLSVDAGLTAKTGFKQRSILGAQQQTCLCMRNFMGKRSPDILFIFHLGQLGVLLLFSVYPSHPAISRTPSVDSDSPSYSREPPEEF